MLKLMKIALIILSIFLINNNSINCLDSYLYLSDKVIKEEIPIGSFIADLTKELESNQNYKNRVSNTQQFTLLDDSKLINGNGYFELDSSSGVLSTKRNLDREYMCLNRQCADPCEVGTNSISHGRCRINLKVLLMPSYDILNLNILIEDINDNKPVFRSNNLTQQINENVPIGYKIPIDLAFDPDIGKNSIDRYELREKTSNRNSHKAFKLLQNLNESQLYLVVESKLDRELISSYNFTIIAYDGGSPSMSGSLNMNVELVDINDNNPVFEKNLYKYTLSEDTPVDTIIGRIKATDLDQGLNGLVKYRFVDVIQSNPNTDHRFVIQKGNVVQTKQNIVKYFDLDEMTGVLRLKMPLDFEDESIFSLTVEARDSGVGSLPAHATIDINVLDVNDNQPDISVSFLNTLFKNQSKLEGYKYDVFIPENTKSNKFLAHVSIVDKDSGYNNNGKFDWKISVNDKLFYTSKQGLITKFENEQEEAALNYLKLIKLNENSFTLNIGSQSLMDREKNDHFNVSIHAWDHGKPKLNDSYYNFTVRLIDINDNAPKFDKYTYDESFYENNEPFQVIFKVNAIDLDAPGPNSNITYTIREAEMNEYFYIDKNGHVYAKVKFDREQRDKYVFLIIAEDQGQPQSLSSSALVNLNILDLNDNQPIIMFNTSFYHKVNQPISKSNNKDKFSYNVHLKIGENTQPNAKIIEFKGIDYDLNENSYTEFSLDSENNFDNMFKLSSTGNLILTKTLNRHIQDLYEFVIICKDLGQNPNLYSKINLTIEILEKSQYCINLNESDNNDLEEQKIGFFNRDQQIIENEPINLFKIDYILVNEKLNKSDQIYSYQKDSSSLQVEQLTHKDLVELKTFKIINKNNSINMHRMEINFNSNLTQLNITRLLLGKYTIKMKLIDQSNPTCIRQEAFTLLIGNNFINKQEMITFLQTYKQKNLTIKNNTIISNANIPNKIKTEDLINNSDEDENANSNGRNDDDDHNDEDEKEETDESVFSVHRNSKQSPSNNFYSKHNNKHRYSLMKSDYILLFILIVIIVVTSIMFVFIAIICIYSKYKKQYNNKKNKNNNNSVNKNIDVEQNLNEDTDDNLHLPTNRYLTNKKSLAKKTKLLNATDLNTSSSSTSSSQANSDNLTKPQYTLVNNKSSSSSSSSCNATHSGTLTYNNNHIRNEEEVEDEDDDFGLLSTVNTNTISRKLRDSKHNYQIKQQQLLANQRYLYSTLATKNYQLDSSNRSNSAAESMLDSTTTNEDHSSFNSNIVVIDSQRNHHLNHNNKLNSLKLPKNEQINHYNYHLQHQQQQPPPQQHSSSSAYSSITNSELMIQNNDINSSTSVSPTNSTNMTTLIKTNHSLNNDNSILRKQNDSNLLSFKKNGIGFNKNNGNVNSFNNNNKNNTSVNNNARPTLRTYDL